MEGSRVYYFACGGPVWTLEISGLTLSGAPPSQVVIFLGATVVLAFASISAQSSRPAAPDLPDTGPAGWAGEAGLAGKNAQPDQPHSPTCPTCPYSSPLISRSNASLVTGPTCLVQIFPSRSTITVCGTTTIGPYVS